jgi:transposase
MDLTPEAVRDRCRRAVLLSRAGESAQEVAGRVGVSQRTVVRYRARMRQTVGRS